MSFGFSVGDFVAVGTLIVKIVDTLRGAQSEYQELIRELESLQRALSQVDKLKGRGDQAIAVDQIKCAALTCAHPLEEFLAKIQKYEKSLGSGKSVTKIKDAGRKVQYAFGKKDEVNTLRSYLNIHIGTINMLLVRQGLEMLDVSSEQTVKNKEELSERIEDSSREFREVRGNVEAQSLAVRENNSIIQKLFWMVSGEIAAPLRSLCQTVTKVCVTTQQIYTIVFELKASVLSIDTRFTYFQAPVRVEDALGRVFPFPSECSIEALNAEIKARFKEGPGKTKVLGGDFEIFNAKSTDQVFTISGRNVLIPGMPINMAIVLEQEFAEGDKCPMPHCVSRTFREAVGGGRTCSECDLWFDKASKKRKRDSEGENFSDRNYHEARRRKIDEKIHEVEHSDSEETSIGAFKRIRFGKWASDRRKGQEEVSEAAEANKRQYMNGVPFNSAPHMMANDGGLLKKPEHLLAELNGINPSNLSDSQFASFQQQNDAVRQKSFHIYAQNLAKNQRQQELSSAGEMSHQDSPLTYHSKAKISGGVTTVAASSDTLQDREKDSRLNAIDLLTKNGYHSDNSPDSSWPLDDSRENSPSPKYLPPPERSPTPEYLSRSSNLNSKGKKRRPKAQASQGDAVLIGYMGGLKHPDLTTKTGEVPLPQSDDSDVDDPIDVKGNNKHTNRSK